MFAVIRQAGMLADVRSTTPEHEQVSSRRVRNSAPQFVVRNEGPVFAQLQLATGCQVLQGASGCV